MVVIASGLTFFCASLRFFLLLKVMEMEDADYQGKPSSFPCSCFNFFTLIMVGFWLFITISISDNLVDIVKNFEEIFKAKEAIYANFSSPQIMIQMDKLQQTFKCCGASGIESWYKQDLYKFLKINASKDHSDVERYWSRFKECHASGKNSELNEFMSFHSKSNNKGKVTYS